MSDRATRLAAIRNRWKVDADKFVNYATKARWLLDQLVATDAELDAAASRIRELEARLLAVEQERDELLKEMVKHIPSARAEAAERSRDDRRRAITEEKP